MKIHAKALVLSLLSPLAVGGLSALLTRDSMTQFEQLNKPPYSPPGWLFPVVWSVLFLLMGLACYLAFLAEEPRRPSHPALILYSIQLLFTFLWTIFFFRAQLYIFSLFWLIALWLLIAATAFLFRRLRSAAALLMTPCLLWVAFAGYLNYGVYRLN